MTRTYRYRHPRPSVAVDLILFGIINHHLRVLVGRRLVLPHQGRACLPGTYIHESESAEDACARKITSIGLAHSYLEQLYTFTSPKRDPRERVVSIAYYGLIKVPGRVPQGDEKIGALEWILPETAEKRRWAFDHRGILTKAVARLRAKIQYAPISSHFLANDFTLFELCQVYQAILGREVDLPNFRRDLLRQKLVLPTGTRKLRGPTATTYAWNYKNEAPFFLPLG